MLNYLKNIIFKVIYFLLGLTEISEIQFCQLGCYHEYVPLAGFGYVDGCLIFLSDEM